MSNGINIQFSGNDDQVQQIIGRLNSLSFGNVQGGSATTGAGGVFGGSGSSTGGGLIVNSPSGLDAGQLCQQYQNFRPLLQALLPSIRSLPLWGQKLATGIEIVMTIADAYCGTGN